MAPFNRRQIGYIQAIAGRQQHRTLVCGQHDGVLHSETAISDAWRVPQTLGKVGDDNVVVGGVTYTASNSAGLAAHAKSLLMHTWHLDHPELAFDARAANQNNTLEKDDFDALWNVDVGFGNATTLDVFNAPVKGTYQIFDQPGNQGSIIQDDTDPATGNVSALSTNVGELIKNPDLVSSIHRVTPDGFLNSTDLKFRFTLPTSITVNSTNPMGQDHYEFRWIVWRSKKPTAAGKVSGDQQTSNMDIIRNGCSFRHPGYDLFMGQTGRKRGFLGYTWNPNLDGDAKVYDDPEKGDPTGEAYSGKYLNSTANGWVNGTYSKLQPDGEIGFTVDDLMTCRLNRDDYVIMKDVRFFLGKEHGKSHFEDTVHWDWNDPIDTQDDNMLTSPTLNTKNYRWHMTLFGTTGGKTPVQINHQVRWTTKSESG